MELPSENPNPNTVQDQLPQTSRDGVSSCGLSKNKLRKLRRHEQSLESRKFRRAKEREQRKNKGLKKRRGNDEKLAEIQKLKNALEVGCKVVIDCQYQNHMSTKERTRFAQQLRRVYSSNRAATSPLHLYLTSLSQDSELFKICCKQNDGFENYVLDITENSVLNSFEPSEVVYLTPDATDVISLDKGFEQDKIYVIGGLVDETTTKNLTHQFAQTKNVTCARLPIDVFFQATEKGTYKKVLTINQVVDIILEWHLTKDWVAAISKGLPERTGFQPKDPNTISSKVISGVNN
ncbi:unnamed protein product [Orchesella dallaii]|uniref:SAM-dependent MTase TRM10-type domain-containing protein n=1 Tax=Orchesella dallaii TaxID=48710 RepID=A0ABP1PSP5_9HEXA